jgi:hypothetical protein
MTGDIVAASMVDGEVNIAESTACVSVTYIIIVITLFVYTIFLKYPLS